MKNQVSSDDTHPSKKYKLLLKNSIIVVLIDSEICLKQRQSIEMCFYFQMNSLVLKKLHIDCADFMQTVKGEKSFKWKSIAEIA